MIDREFFESRLSHHVSEKLKETGEGAASVRLRLTTGESFSVITFIEATDGYAVVEVFPEDGKLRRNPKEERGMGAPQFDLDRLLVPPRWTAQTPPLIDTSNPTICGSDRDRGVLLRGFLRTQVGVDLGAPAPWSALEDVGVM
jgi:hypothetical protein